MLNGASASSPATFGQPDTHSPALVSSRGTNNQLMTKYTFDREQQRRMEHKEQQRAAKRQKRDARDQHRILSHLDSTGAGTSREMTVDGIRFLLAANGSKLTRLPGERVAVNDMHGRMLRDTDNSIDRVTPKKATVAGVDFHRTRNGNLVRASALKTPIRYRSL